MHPVICGKLGSIRSEAFCICGINLQYYKGLVADVNAQKNGLKYVEKNGDGFTFTARKSDGTASGIKDQALKTATEIKPSVKAASGSYGEFLRVDLCCCF